MDELRYELMLKHPPTGTTLNKNYINKYGVGVTISFFILLAVVSPIIFARPDGCFARFLNTGQIGDTIGGLTAPIIGVLNAILLWWTLRKQGHQISEQNLQNRIERKRNKLDDLIKNQSLSIRETGSPLFTNYQGMELIFVLIDFFSANMKSIEDSEIRKRDWEVYMLYLSDILKTATHIANVNLIKKDSFEDKIYLYVEIDEQMSSIFRLVSLLQKFNDKHKNDEEFLPYNIPRYVYQLDMFRTLFASRNPIALKHREAKKGKSAS